MDKKLSIKEVFKKLISISSSNFETILLLLFLLSVLVYTGVGFMHSSHPEYDIFHDEVELHMQACKCEIVDQVNNYIYKIAPTSALSGLTLTNLCQEYDIDIMFVLAQGQIESHYGTRGIAAKTNSVWNVYSYDGRTAEDIKKSSQHYKHPNHSIEPYLKLLKKRYLVNKTEHELFLHFVDVDGRRYASAEDYEDKMFATYQKIDSVTKLDSLQKQYKKYQLILYK